MFHGFKVFNITVGKWISDTFLNRQERQIIQTNSGHLRTQTSFYSLGRREHSFNLARCLRNGYKNSPSVMGCRSLIVIYDISMKWTVSEIVGVRARIGGGSLPRCTPLATCQCYFQMNYIINRPFVELFQISRHLFRLKHRDLKLFINS